MLIKYMRQHTPNRQGRDTVRLIWIFTLISFTVISLLGCHAVQVTKTKAPTSGQNQAQDKTGSGSGNQTKKKTESVDGIPFYVKKAACKHEVVWLEPIYSLTLEDINTPPEKDAKPQTTPLGSAVLSFSQYREDAHVIEFLKAFNQVGAKYDAVLKNWDAIMKVPYTPTKFPENARDRLLLSNSNGPDIYVDYGETYYINAKRPLAGSAKVDSKFASDGTLTEASAEIESKTLETLLGPVNTAISSGLAVAAKAGEKLPDKHLKLTTEVSGYKHTFSRIDPSATFPCSVISSDNIPNLTDKDSKLFNYTRESVSSASAADKKNKNKIQVSGEIVLPESASKDTADKKDPPQK